MIRLYVLLIVNIFCSFFCIAQNKASARYEIDAKRIGVNPTEKDALPRSREFLRLDSTYYVGWMYEGMYKYDRSADYLGYKNAIAPLNKALVLIEKDYDQTLRNIFSSISYFSQNITRFQDLYMVMNALKECYDNIEMPDSVMALLDNIERYHFQRDYFGVYFQRAWEFHRNRFFTNKDFDFLKSSVTENEQAALQSCYAGFAQIEKNKQLNDAWFGPGESIQDRLRIYHYLALLHCYNKNYDSSNFYYQQLAENGAISWNNYGGMQSEIGNFANAIDYFNKDIFSVQRILREPYYYLPQLYVYGGKTKQAISMCRYFITQNGSTPGFGWYNIALARSYMYDGQLDSASYALDKAASFKELHIGTTLTQTQYDFTINLIKVELLDKQIAQVKFFNKGWWYSLKSLYNIASLKLQKIMSEYVVVNQLAYDPDRTRLVYDLFCAESTTNFDEAWFLLKNFSPKYFGNKYEEYQRTDTRQNIQRYFKLFAAQFAWENGDKKDARKAFEAIAQNTVLDTANEKLYIGRLYENLSKASEDTKREFSDYRNSLIDVYPQLVPFSGITMSVHLSTSGTEDEHTDEVISDLKDCRIDFESNEDAPSATISFIKKGDKYEANINVVSVTGKKLVTNEKLVFSNIDGVGKELALRLFGKGGALVFEQPAPDS